MDFLKDHKELDNKTNEHSGSKQRKNNLPTVASCLSSCKRQSLTRKGHVTAY